MMQIAWNKNQMIDQSTTYNFLITYVIQIVDPYCVILHNNLKNVKNHCCVTSLSLQQFSRIENQLIDKAAINNFVIICVIQIMHHFCIKYLTNVSIRSIADYRLWNWSVQLINIFFKILMFLSSLVSLCSMCELIFSKNFHVSVSDWFLVLLLSYVAL